MTKKITCKRLENIALYYLERYSSSSANLRRILQRRLLKDAMKGFEIPEDSGKWVEETVARMVRLGYVDDERYREDLVRRLQSQGKSARQIRLKLLEKGVDADFETDEDDEYRQALIFIRKKKLGFYRGRQRRDHYRKDMQKLALAGFSYAVSRKVLELEEAGGAGTQACAGVTWHFLCGGLNSG